MDTCNSSCTFDMVTNGSLSLSLEQVSAIDCLVDYERPWIYPEGIRPKRLWHDSSESPIDRSSLTRLRSILASWLDLSKGDKELPLCRGSLISLPFRLSQEQARHRQQIFRLVANSGSEVQETDTSYESVCVIAKDLPELLLKSSASVCQKAPSEETNGVLNRISMSKRDLLLNLLPSTTDMLVQSSEFTSNLTHDLECFDSLILLGEVGSGKTHTALFLAARARCVNGYATLYLDCKKLQSSSEVRMKNILQALTDTFQEADEARPCVVVLDDVDELIPNINMGTSEDEGSAHRQQANPVAVNQAKVIGDHLNNLMNNASTSQRQEGKLVFFVLTCRDEHSIYPTVVSQRFYRSMHVPSFNAEHREQLFAAMRQNLAGEGLSLIQDGTLLKDFGSRTEGFRPRDLDMIAARALHILQSSKNKEKDPNQNLAEAVNDALGGFVPISRQGIRVEDVRSSISWSQVGGLFRVKDYLSSTVLRPVKYRRIYQHSPIRLPRGIVLFGPPGCGKSYLVPALAKECRLTLITCRGPELLDKYIGASEAKVRQLFQRAYAAAPSLLFLDEFDALAPVRGSDNTGVTDRVVNQLLTYLDGVEDAAKGSVYIVAATSRPDKVDPALMRPGRLEQHIFVGFPSSEEEWHSVLEQALPGHEIDGHLQEAIVDRNLWEIEDAAHVRSFSPSDIKAVVDTAYLNAVHEFLACSDDPSDDMEDDPIVIQIDHMVKALKSTRPSLSIDDRRMLNHIYRPYISASDRPDDECPAENEPRRLMTALK